MAKADSENDLVRDLDSHQLEAMAPRLLAGRDSLSRPEKDEILANVLAGVKAPPERRRRVGWWAAAALGLSAMALLIFWQVRPDSEFRARGTDSLGIEFTIECDTPCSAGSDLHFFAGGGRIPRFFAAFARSERGEIIWYFPASEGADSAELPPRKVGDGAVDRSPRSIGQAAVIDAGYAPGRYQLYGVFSRTPVTRAQLREGLSSGELPSAGKARSIDDWVVIAREFAVQ